MKTGFLIALFFLGVIHISMAQETDNQQVSPIAVQDAFIQTGFISGGPRTGTIEDFKELAKHSVFLNSEIWDFSRNSRLWIRVKGLFSAQLGLRFRDHQKPLTNRTRFYDSALPIAEERFSPEILNRRK